MMKQHVKDDDDDEWQDCDDDEYNHIITVEI